MFSLSESSLAFSSASGRKSVLIVSDVPFGEASVLPDWASVDYKAGEGGATEALFSVSENMSERDRSCTAVFESEAGMRAVAIRQKGRGHLRVTGRRDLILPCFPSSVSIEVDCNVPYDIQISDDWVSRRRMGLADMIGTVGTGFSRGALQLDVAYNDNDSERSAAVVLFNTESSVSDTLYIVQSGNANLYGDGSCVCIQRSEVGGANIVVMGDGFTLEDMEKGGRYDTVMRQAVEYFFSIEPYTSYRRFFNVYMVAAVSEQSGVGSEDGDKVRNRFGSRFGSGTSVSCDDDTCFEYARKVPELDAESPLLVIVVLNSREYYGTTYMYADGNAIALCPISAMEPPNDFEGLIHHEAGGHGFGLLCDEYVYYRSRMPESRKRGMIEWRQRGFYLNLDFTDDVSEVAWSRFIGLEKYPFVGTFEGGYEYAYGVWRPERNSCMNDNVPYYNVQSRYLIVSRVMALSGREISVDEFMAADNVDLLPETRSLGRRPLPPLGEPVMIE